MLNMSETKGLSILDTFLCFPGGTGEKGVMEHAAMMTIFIFFSFFAHISSTFFFLPDAAITGTDAATNAKTEIISKQETLTIFLNLHVRIPKELMHQVYFYPIWQN